MEFSALYSPSLPLPSPLSPPPSPLPLPPSPEEVTKGSAKMKEVEAQSIPVVDEGLISLWKPGGSPPSISDSLISDWGKEVGRWSCEWAGQASLASHMLKVKDPSVAVAVQRFRDKYEPPPKRKASSEPGSLPVLNIVVDDVLGPCRQAATWVVCTECEHCIGPVWVK